MKQTSLVIITPIKPEHAEELRTVLKEKIEPQWDPAAERLICTPTMPFDKLRMLHFACFAILEEGQQQDALAPCLMLEASIDGTPSDFLDDLIELCGPGLDEIYAHCQGYPDAGTGLPRLVHTYLISHDIKPHIFFQGHPGRSLSEIHGEEELRCRLVAELKSLADQDAGLPSDRTSILRRLRRVALTPPGSGVGKDSDFRWVAEKRDEPFETRLGQHLTILAGGLLALLIAAAGVYLAVPDPQAFVACMQSLTSQVQGCASAFDNGWAGRVTAFLTDLPFIWRDLAAPWLSVLGIYFWAASSAVITWAIARGVRYLCERHEKPGDAGVRWLLLQILRLYAALASFGALAVLFGFGLATVGSVSAPAWLAYQTVAAALVGVLGTIVCAIALLYFRYIRSMPALDRMFGHATAQQHAKFSFASDGLRLVMVIIGWLMLVALNWVTGAFDDPPGAIFSAVISWGVTGTLSVLVALAAVLTVGAVWLLWVYVQGKLVDDRIYEDARILTHVPTDTTRFDREGHGVNKMQNHLISVSRIKPGRLRLLRLRLVLFLVNQMCRWWFTRGVLGDVPDIHFLRWLIIDKGRRLLFLDTYQGSWSSYLDGFIDSGSVRLLNAIWSHTYQHVDVDGVDTAVGFPRTECLGWKGARDERPFKRAVRSSQKESMVWYSAYPQTGGVNIHTNSRIRNALFENLDEAEIDMLISNIR